MKSVKFEKEAWLKGYRLLAGIDEAGRGPLAGPVVAAAVILKRFDFKERIDDSKRLTPRQRERAFVEITQKAIFGIGVISPKLIDEVNIVNATIMAMKQALFNLLVKPDFVLVDGNMDLDIDIPYKSIIKGDRKSVSIASASIVAKVVRDNIMRRYNYFYPLYYFFKHKGYPTRQHLSILRQLGPTHIHRRTFLR